MNFGNRFSCEVGFGVWLVSLVALRQSSMMPPKTKPKRSKWALHLDATGIERLRELSKVTRIACSVFVREGIHDLLLKYDKTLKEGKRSKVA
jgi:hypothetical protein